MKEFILFTGDFWLTLLADVSLGVLGLALWFIFHVRKYVFDLNVWEVIKRYRRFFYFHLAALGIVATAYQVGPDDLVSLLQSFGVNLPGEFAFVSFSAAFAATVNGENKTNLLDEIRGHKKVIKDIKNAGNNNLSDNSHTGAGTR